jgi:hypothetical protein
MQNLEHRWMFVKKHISQIAKYILTHIHHGVRCCRVMPEMVKICPKHVAYIFACNKKVVSDGNL